ncbi:hypothetical protein PIB30_040527 [Stylosanthes scabra]|uniref:Ubiquitin-like protease family profile domain-containing protein n=1 Tax=Stylosanthes scabra TaxID=79078 RepID=A0ABU6SFB4_9FABA|nr:hypothetical protein [Stylosanthes scabra]
MLARLYKWATKPTEDNAYERVFNFKGGKEYTAMRYHLMSLAEEAEVDMTIMEIMCILNNMDKNNEKFIYATCCVPPLFMHSILERYGPRYIDAKTGLPRDISTTEDMDPLRYIDANKLKSAPYVFTPILFAKHWWLYVLDVNNKKFYALDSLNTKSPSSDRNKIGRFASSVLNQIRVRAGATTIFPNKTRAVAELQEFREKYVEHILYHSKNYYRHKAIKALNSVTRQPKPSTALQSPYTQLNTADLESGKSDAS